MQKIHESEGMEGLEKIYENLEFTEAKRNSLRKSISMIMADWREFERHLETTQKCLMECLNELESREKQLDCIQESVTQDSEGLRLMRNSLEEKVKEVADKELELNLLREKKMAELELQEKEWVLKKEEFFEEFSKREVKLREKERAAEEHFGKLEREKNEIVWMDKLVEERLREVGLKEKSFEDRVKEFEKRMNELDDRERKIKECEKDADGLMRMEREKEIEMKEKEVSLMREDLEFKEKELEFERVVNDTRKRELDIREKQLEAKKNEYEITQDRLEKIYLKEKECLLEKELNEKGKEDLEVKTKEHKDSINGVKALQIREKQLETRWNEVERREKQLEAKMKELEATHRCLKELSLAKKEYQLEKELLEKENKELEQKKKEIEDRINGVQELQIREKQLEMRRIEVERREKQLEMKKKELEAIDECLKELSLAKEECQSEKELLEKGNKELEQKKKELEDRINGLNELQTREKQLETRRNKVGRREKQLETEKKELEATHECLMECQLEKELLEKGNKELEQKKKELEHRINGVKELQTREKQLETRRNEVERREKQLELKKKELEDKSKEFCLRKNELGLKEEQLDDKLHACIKSESVEKVQDEIAISNSSSPHFVFGVELDGLDLHMFLNGREMNLDSADEVLKDLQSSGDPIYMVLTAMETLYPPYLRKVGMEFEGKVAECCILLLGQLMRISPKIQPSVRNEALKLANEWKQMIKTGNSLEVLGFLNLLASFDLAYAFDMMEVMNFLDIVAQHQQTPELCHRLGVTDKIPGFILGLTKKKQLLLAVKYVYEFNLVDKIPPVVLLKEYVKHSKLVAEKICYDGQSTFEAQDKAMMIEISALKSVIKCIRDHGLQSEYLPDQLGERVVLLESRRANLKTSIPSPTSENLPKLDKKNELPVAPQAPLKQDRKKRPCSDNNIMNEAWLPPSNKSRRLAAAAKAAQNVQLATGQRIHSDQPSSVHPGGSDRYGPDIGASTKVDILGGSTPSSPHINHLARQRQSNFAANRNIVHSGFPSDH